MFGPGGDTKQIRHNAAGASQTLAGLLGGGAPAIRSFLGQNPDFMRSAETSLLGLIGGGGEQAAQRVISASQPAFQQNLRFAQSGAAAKASSPFNTAFGLQNLDLTTQALRDFNTFQAQQLASGQERAINAANVLSSLFNVEQAGPLSVLRSAAGFFGPVAKNRAQDQGFFGNYVAPLLFAGAKGASGAAAGKYL